MKALRRSTAVLLAVVIAFSCFTAIAFAAPKITSVEIVQEPYKKVFFKGTDWKYGYWNFPEGSDKGYFVPGGSDITLMHNGGKYSYYSDRGMLDMRGLIVRVGYSDGTFKNIEYKETVSGAYVNQNILGSPKGGYKIGETTIEVYFKANINAYDSYKITFVDNARKDGDINLDNKVNSSDALAILQHIVGLEVLASSQLGSADMNSDGKINSADALAVLKIAVS